MKLWLLTRTDRVSYDEFAGFVIRAATERDARSMAMGRAEGYDHPVSIENPNTWMDPATTCVEMTADGEPGIILYDYRAG